MSKASEPNYSTPNADGTSTVKCPKCQHEFICDSNWLKAATTIGCPKCSALLIIKNPETELPKI